MKVTAPQHDFSFIERQKGMFSFTRLTPLQVDQLRTEYAIYVVSAGGRINVAGLTSGNLSRVCDAIATVL
jgi:aspartate/tyrosine/aromatic aminotransferase